jgi:predicted transcriptional regulator
MDALSFRIPSDVKRSLEAAAKAEYREKTAIILMLLEGYLTDKGYLSREAGASESKAMRRRRASSE